MILSSADILRILGGNEIVRLSAQVSIVDGKPALSGREGIYIYVNRFPILDEFEATWQIWIESDEEDDLIVAELKRLLPRVQATRGLMTTVSTTEFRSENTQRAPEAAKPAQAQVDMSAIEERFQELVEDVQDRMLLVTSGRPGRDGERGPEGPQGRAGRDIVATETNLEDLQNVEQGIPKKDGQVLTWKNGVWQNLHVTEVIPAYGGGGGGEPIGITDLVDVDTDTVAPMVGQVLEWDGTNWVPADAATGITNLGYTASPTDGTVTSDTGTDATIPLADATNAGLLSPTEKTSIGSALQPGDNVSELVNDAGYVTDAGVTQIIAGNNITIDPAGGTGAVTVNAADSVNDADGGDFGELPNPDGGDFDDATTTSTLAYPVDGGDFNAGTSEAFGDSLFDGGEAT